jgi:Virulence-associated protein E
VREQESEADRLREARNRKRREEELRGFGLSDEEIAKELKGGGGGGGGDGAGAGGDSGSAGSTDFIQVEAPKVRQCNQCGALNSRDAPKCTNCGADFTTQPPPKAAYMDTKSRAACNLANVRLALKQERQLMDRFGYDEMLCTEILMRPFDNDTNFKPRPLTDVDVIKMQAWLQSFGFRKIGATAVRDAITEHAHNHSFHPVRDYLNRVAETWDRKERVSTWLSVYAGAPLIMGENGSSTGYIEAVGKMFLVGLVARIYRPGCKFDYHPILEGPQGLQKSKMGETLVGEEYFSDQLPPIGTKDASQHLRGKWLVELPEMHAYTKAQIDEYKTFMTRRTERYRPPYGHKEVHEPRQCGFMGTTNKMRYLRDETGNRRSWPLAVGEIKIEALQRDRDQLWGEVVQLFRKGERWWPDYDFEHEHIRPQQDARFEPDPWEPLIRDYLKLRTSWYDPKRPHKKPHITLMEIAEEVLGFTTKQTVSQGELVTPINRLDPKVGQRISAVLHHLRLVPRHTKLGRWWEPGPDWSPD